MRVKKLLESRQIAPRNVRPPLILCLGDSVTHGCFENVEGPGGVLETVYEPESGWAAILQRELRALYPAAAATVLNAGVGGDNAPGGLARLERDALSCRPDLLIVCYGLNDCTFPDEAAGLRQYKRAIAGIFSEAKKEETECLLLTPNAMCRYVDAGLSGKFAQYAAVAARAQNEGVLDRYVDAGKEIARNAGTPVADAYSVWRQWHDQRRDTTALLANRINHPDRASHAVFANECLKQILSDEDNA